MTTSSSETAEHEYDPFEEFNRSAGIGVIENPYPMFALVRPQKKRQLAQQRMLEEIKVGDEVVTAGGIYGEVTQDAGDDVMVRIAPGVEVRVARRAIGGVIPPDEPAEPDEPEEENPADPGTLSQP